MKRWVLCIVASLSLIGVFHVAKAAPPVCVYLEGIVTSGEDRFNDLGFGAGEGVLNGQVVEVTLYYLSALAPSNSSSDPLMGFYHRDDFPSWMSMPTITIGGVNLDIPDVLPLPHPAKGVNPDQRVVINLVTNGVRIVRDLDWIKSALFIDLGAEVEIFFNNIATIDLPKFLPASEFVSGFGTVWLDMNDGPTLLHFVIANFNVTSASFRTIAAPESLDSHPPGHPPCR